MALTKHEEFSHRNRAGETLSRRHFVKLLAVLIVIVAFSCATLTGCDSRPSDDEVKSCILDLPTPLGSTQRALYGGIDQLEFGKAFASEGGMMEMAMGAPKGTKVFPTKAHMAQNGLPGPASVYDYWVFKDSFGKLQCVRQ